VRIYDVATDAKLPYIVMEHVEGLPLTNFIGNGLLSSESEVLRIAHDVVAALEYIHQHGVLWGDPKPGNVMVTPQGRVVLLDFGIARVVDSFHDDSSVLVGTPGYMPPELVRGEPADVRSEIYSVGVLLYEMVRGTLPFATDGSMSSVFTRSDWQPESLDHAEHVSGELKRAILKCLAARKEDRFTTAADLLKALPAPSAVP